MRRSRIGRLGLVVVLAAGCGHAPASAGDTARRFAAAVAAGRVDDAWALMSADYRQHHSRDELRYSLSPTTARALGQLGDGSVQLRAELELGDGERLELVQEADGWRFARNPLDVYPQAAPDEALRSFIRAVERERWDVLLRFIPQRYRATLTAEALRQAWSSDRRAELQAQLAAARAHLAEPLELRGDEARLPVGERKQVKLVREAGVWKLESLE